MDDHAVRAAVFVAYLAAHLVISERTALAHVSPVLAKMGLTSRTQAALLAVKEGLVQPR